MPLVQNLNLNVYIHICMRERVHIHACTDEYVCAVEMERSGLQGEEGKQEINTVLVTQIADKTIQEEQGDQK